MAALFSRKSNTRIRLALLALPLVFVAIVAGLLAWVRSPAATGVGRAPEQPMWFDHRHHVAGYRIDCRYCHSTVEKSATASVPATEVCVPCHTDQWMNSPYFEPVRASLETGLPIPWVRVHDLPDFVFFNHAIHVNKGVGCETCHGRVDRMALVTQVAPLTMEWCLECHRDPAPYLRPVEEITTMGWEPEVPRERLARELMVRYDVASIVTCTGCHR